MNTVTDIIDNYNACKGGGGGESCDYSTCTMTVTAQYPNNTVVLRTDFGNYEMEISSEGEILVILYQGEAYFEGEDVAQVSVSGNAEITEQEEQDGTWFFNGKLTGDCTISMTGVPIL